MTKKTWIKIKRGLLDPKHRERIGIRIWLYLHMLDRASWEEGAVLEWKDHAAADELEMDLTTVRAQRRQLEAGGYIRCIQRGHDQRVVILKWVNPREYSGHVYNTPDVAGAGKSASGESSTLDEDEAAESEDQSEGSSEGQSEGFPQALPSDSQIHISQVKGDQTPWVQALTAIQADRFPRRTRGDNFERYFQPTVALGLADGRFQVACEDEDQRAWLESNGQAIAENALVGVLGRRVRVEFVLEEVPS